MRRRLRTEHGPQGRFESPLIFLARNDLVCLRVGTIAVCCWFGVSKGRKVHPAGKYPESTRLSGRRRIRSNSGKYQVFPASLFIEWRTVGSGHLGPDMELEQSQGRRTVKMCWAGPGQNTISITLRDVILCDADGQRCGSRVQNRRRATGGGVGTKGPLVTGHFKVRPRDGR